ncbi:hypothetical protein IV203_002364 [Nitzschia inconspicua]|uniref:Uncharacterized protein n=1 Tax=Nitzschia inconspicua TaxID=303405 RepID=A0A9K3LB80_9STRA|nr:hypothetical protein IV203_002364 [Nitzschia inconspicua]
MASFASQSSLCQFRGFPDENAKLSCDADAGVVDGFALVKAQQKRGRPTNRTIRNGKHWPVQQRICMAKMEPTALMDALPKEYGSLGQDPFKKGPHIFLVKFHLSVDCSQWTRLYPDTTLIGLRVFDWSTSYDNPEYHCMMLTLRWGNARFVIWPTWQEARHSNLPI